MFVYYNSQQLQLQFPEWPLEGGCKKLYFDFNVEMFKTWNKKNGLTAIFPP